MNGVTPQRTESSAISSVSPNLTKYSYLNISITVTASLHFLAVTQQFAIYVMQRKLSECCRLLVGSEIYL
jgi:hypothetical protein